MIFIQGQNLNWKKHNLKGFGKKSMFRILCRPASQDSIQDLQHYVSNGMDITRFTLTKVVIIIIKASNKPLSS